MRTLTAQETKVLAAPAGYTVRFRVKVYGPHGAWVDLSDFHGQDWCEGASYADDLEAVALATVQLRREATELLSLAPLRTNVRANLLTGSYDPLIREGRQFTIETATVPLGMQAASADWREVFAGTIDEVDAAGEVMTFTGRDGAGAMQDKFIETEVTYSNASGTAVETVMGQILTDNGFSAADLVTPVTPGWFIRTFVQRREPVLDALKVLANQIGWALQWKWVNGTGFRLVFFAPDRLATVPLYELNADRYTEVSSCTTSRIDVRNKWDVFYNDASDLDAEGQPKRKTVFRSDAASIAKYGTRYAAISEAFSSEIDSFDEAEKLCEAALADTKDVLLQKAVTIDYFYAAQLEDLIRLKANSVHYSADQDLAVIGISHNLSADAATTTLTLRGKPTLGVAHWLGRIQHPSVARITNTAAPLAPQSISSAPITNGIAITFTEPPEGRPADWYELHVSTVNGFTPDASTLKEVSYTTRFEYTGLTPGTTYYAKVVPVAVDGTKGATSAQQTITAAYVGPANLIPYVDAGALPPNADFEAHTDINQPPDTWAFRNGVANNAWGTAADVVPDSYTGAKALRIKQDTSLRSQFFAVNPGDLYSIESYVKAESGSETVWTVYIRFTATPDDAASTLLQVVAGGTGVVTATTTFQKFSQAAFAPTAARFACVVIQRGATAANMVFDSVRVRRATLVEAPWSNIGAGGFLSDGVTPVPGFENGWANSGGGLHSVAMRKDHTGRVWLRGTMKRAANDYTAAFTVPAGYRPSAQSRPAVSIEGGGGLDILSNGVVAPFSYAVNANVSLDGVSWATD